SPAMATCCLHDALPSLDRADDEVRVPIDGHSGSKEVARALVIESPLPVGDGGRRDQDAPGTLRMIPATGRLDLKDLKALDGRVRSEEHTSELQSRENLV